jgi:DNA-binding response OmpR family regulator
MIMIDSMKHNAGRAAFHVLVVEDNPMIAELMATRLQGAGLVASTCLGGGDAIDFLTHRDVDLMILDVMMPEIDGYEVLKFARAQNRTRNLPVIFVTAKSTRDDIERGVALGADHYVTKPFNGADLIRQVKVLLGQPRRVELATA